MYNFLALVSLFCLLAISPHSQASLFPQPPGYVWDSTKKFLAPEVLPIIEAKDVEPWYKSRDIAIKFIENTLKNSTLQLSKEVQGVLREAALRLSKINIIVINPNDNKIKEGFAVEDTRFDTYDCESTEIGAYVNFFDNDVNICRFYLFVPDHYRAQVLIHESIHLGGLSNEIETTMLEYYVMKSNGRLPVPNGYINPSNSKEKFAEAIDYSDNHFRAYMHPLRWAKVAERSCKISLEYGTGLFNRTRHSLEFNGSLFRGSPSVYQDSILNKKIEYFAFGESASDFDNLKEGSVALLKRGNTTFTKKMEFASGAKAAGVIIFDEQSSDESILSGVVSMRFSRDSIPFIGVSKADGLAIKQLIETEGPAISVDCEF